MDKKQIIRDKLRLLKENSVPHAVMSHDTTIDGIVACDYENDDYALFAILDKNTYATSRTSDHFAQTRLVQYQILYEDINCIKIYGLENEFKEKIDENILFKYGDNQTIDHANDKLAESAGKHDKLDAYIPTGE